jgi:hypothetical protein
MDKKTGPVEKKFVNKNGLSELPKGMKTQY